MPVSKNRPFYTLGAAQCWADLRIRSGWRLQQNIWSKRCRILDPFDIRRAKGTKEQCKQDFIRLVETWEVPAESENLIILIHGLGRTKRSFKKIQQHLKKLGNEAIAINYPSTRQDINTHANNLEELLNNLDGVKTVSFVTHSLGGIILRKVLAKNSAWKDRIAIGRIVMIAPPNQGSKTAAFLKNILPIKLLMGSCLSELTPAKVKNIPEINTEFGVIAGGRGKTTKGFDPFLNKDNDGLVTVEETQLKGSSDFLHVNAIHTFILNNKIVVGAVERFINNGRFARKKLKPKKTRLSEIY